MGSPTVAPVRPAVERKNPKSEVGPRRVSAAERRRFMSGKVADIRAGPQEPTRRRKGKGGDVEDTDEFKKTLREVLDFVTPELSKERRQEMEKARIMALGGTRDRGLKTPYNVLQKERKVAEEKRKKILAEEQYLGVSMSTSKHRKGWAVD